MTDYELMNEINDNDQKEIEEIMNDPEYQQWRYDEDDGSHIWEMSDCEYDEGYY